MSEVQVKTKEKNTTAKHELLGKTWYLIDAKNKVLGRLATRIAIVLMGKTKVEWQPHIDSGDNVVLINSAKVVVTGRKEDQKMYYRYSGYPGGLKTENLSKLRSRKPEEIVRHAVAGMLPKTRLGRAMIKKLFIYPGTDHPHQAQKPIEIEV